MKHITSKSPGHRPAAISSADRRSRFLFGQPVSFVSMVEVDEKELCYVSPSGTLCPHRYQNHPDEGEVGKSMTRGSTVVLGGRCGQEPTTRPGQYQYPRRMILATPSSCLAVLVCSRPKYTFVDDVVLQNCKNKNGACPHATLGGRLPQCPARVKNKKEMRNRSKF